MQAGGRGLQQVEWQFTIQARKPFLSRMPPKKRSPHKGGERTISGVGHQRESGAGPVKPGSLVRVAGFSAVSALFQRAPERVVRLFYEERQARHVGEFCARMAQLRRPYRMVDADELTKIAGTVLHGGVVAVAEPQPEQPLTVAECKRLLNSGTTLFVLDGIGNPHNVGAIARSLAFFGFEHLVFTDHPLQAGLSDAAYRIAEGGLDWLNIWRVSNLAGLLREVRGRGLIVGTALSSRGQSLEELQPRPHAHLILLGNEEQGLAQATLRLCDRVLTLPGSGLVQSLNVASTAAIIAHGLRQR